MLKNVLERLIGTGRESYQHNMGLGGCEFQKDHPGVLVEKMRAGRNEALYQETLRALNSAKPGEIPVVRSNYVSEHGSLRFSGYTYTQLYKR